MAQMKIVFRKNHGLFLEDKMKILKDKVSIIVVSFDVIVILAIVFVKPVVSCAMNVLPACFLGKIGLVCPACGGTRCFYNFFTGNLYASFMYNQFMFFMIVFALILIIVANLAFVFNLSAARKIFLRLSNFRVIIVLAVFYAIFGVVRNLIMNL